MNLKTLQTNFERELLFQLITNMRNGIATKESGKYVSQAFLKVLNETTSSEKFLDELSKIASTNKEIRESFIKVATEYEKESVKDKLEKIRTVLID